MNKVLEINKVSLGYNNNLILKNIEITLSKGDFLVIHGKNGSGKSSFLKFLYMKIFPISGKYRIFGEEVFFSNKSFINRCRKKMGIILQKNFLIPYLSIFQNVQLSFEVQSNNSTSNDNRVFEILKWVGLEKKAELKVVNLSDGEKQKVVIARALVSNPPILIADEPMLYLDSISREKLFFLLKAINKLGTTIIVADNQNKDEYFNSRKVNIEQFVITK
tara:strand:+ start:115 stop:771 length:657 start_codon:yes stop_codon:yes gene_type:complete